MIDQQTLQAAIASNVSAALAEDIGSGDITARLVPESNRSRATVIAREAGVVAGIPWAESVFRSLDPDVTLEWQVTEGAAIEPDQVLLEVNGNSRALLSGERAALNFLQTLSGTATLCRTYADLVVDTGVQLLDTRKTIPGLRIAQKYAVSLGGCFNHRIGLFDAFLIKENHIAACGSIRLAVESARKQDASKPVEVETENLAELAQALDAGADIIMLDNYSLGDMLKAVKLNQGAAKLEASGGILVQTLRPIAETGVDYISIGALTKDCKTIDLSMRFA